MDDWGKCFRTCRDEKPIKENITSDLERKVGDETTLILLYILSMHQFYNNSTQVNLHQVYT